MADYTGDVLSVREARRRVPAYDRAGLNYVLTTQEFFQGVRAERPSALATCRSRGRYRCGRSSVKSSS